MVHVRDALIPFRDVRLDSPRDIASSIERLQALERSNPRSRKSGFRFQQSGNRKDRPALPVARGVVRQGDAVMLNVSTVTPFTFLK